ncbi:MAG: adenylate kinase [Gemmatimonadales bacterium]|nr:MAG: adenylate kinase [Gemmatimonadales bacterium]
MVAILLGPPGVGKGTQGDRLVRALGWQKIATGDLLRAARREGTELGRKAQEYMEAGNLVPDELIVELVKEKLAALSPDTGVLFDGFPRTVPQAEALDAALPSVDRKVGVVILFDAPADVLHKRISGRRSSPDSGRVYNIYFDPPKVEGICDETGSALIHRDDDQPETVARRLEVYRKQTQPLVEYYDESQATLLRIDGDQEMSEVQGDLHAALAREAGIEVGEA